MSALQAFATTKRITEQEDPGLVAVSGQSSSSRGRTVVADPYAWERAYERPWEAIQEDEEGMLRVETGKARRAAQRKEVALARVQRGMLRNVFLVLDMSRAMEASDSAFKPSRSSCQASAAKDFVREYFDANPISALGVIIIRDGVAHMATELGSNPRKHVNAIVEHCEKRSPGGDWSLQNGLEMARRMLALVPHYATREVVVVHSALSTVDSGNIFETLSHLSDGSKSAGPGASGPAAAGSSSGAPRVRVSVISMAGEVYIAARAAAETGGTSAVPSTHEALRLALLSHCAPPPRSAAEVAAQAASAGSGTGQSVMMQMGFPELLFEQEGMCACHKMLRPRAYICPRCSARCCEIPSKCVVCGLQLVSAPSLARSYHHLFPVPPFTEVPSAHEPGRLQADADGLDGADGDDNDNVADGDEGMEDGLSAGEEMEVNGAGAGAGAGASSSAAVARKRPRAGSISGLTSTTRQSGTAGTALTSRSRRRHGRYVHNSDCVCSGCAGPLAEVDPRYVCPDCSLAFCSGCDSLIHDTLHACPGCAATGAAASGAAAGSSAT